MGSRLEKKSTEIRKRIEKHEFGDEEGDEYEGSKFGGFTEYFRRKKIKLQNLDAELRANSTDKPLIFKGIVAHVNGYTQPSLNDLHALIVSHGGGFMQYLDGKTMVTHIIASNLTLKKAAEFRKYRIAKPAWIVDSVAAGKLQPWENYRVVDEGAGQKLLAFDNGGLSTQINNNQTSYKEQTERSWYTSQLKREKGTIETSPPVENDSVESHTAELPPVTASGSRTISGELRVEKINPSEADPAETVEVVERASLSPEPPAQDIASPPSAHKSRSPGPFEFPHNPFAPDPDGPKGALDLKSTRTAEEHNAILMSDPNLRKSSVLNPGFLEQYYGSSRLHHLSTWKAELKSQLQALTAAQTLSQKASLKRPPGARRYILHVDFDSFFVAVSLRKHPDLADKPCAVAHGSGSSSEIASCNYPARAFGLKNGMWMKRAQEMCSELKVLPYDFPAYEEASRMFYDAIVQSGGLVQSVSIDEALVDVSSLCIAAGSSDGIARHEGSVDREQAKAEALATELRAKVKQLTGCAVSVGIGGNILLAKVALRKAKPAGQYHVRPEEALDFIGGLSVQDLPGVAHSIGGKLEEIGIKFVKDVREVSKERLINVLGPKTGEKIYNYARGIDKAEVGDQVMRKSVSAEVNWGVRFETQEQVDEFMGSLSGELERRLLKEGVKGRQLTVKVMRKAADAPLDPPKHLGHGKCDTFNKSVALGVATNSKTTLTKEVLSIMRQWAFSPGELRGLGVQMTKLEPLKAEGLADGSQPRLRFAATHQNEKASSSKRVRFASPSDKQSAVTTLESTTNHKQFKMPAVSRDPIAAEVEDQIAEDPITPRKNKSATVAAAAISSVFKNMDSPSKKPLNIAGTQFILPTQVDAQVLAELPDDIRKKLTRHVNTIPASEGPFSPVSILPNQSQLDPSILQALPEDVRGEILAQYERSPSKPKAGQSLLPQSPRKGRSVALPKGKGLARGRGQGGGSLLSRFKSVASRQDTPTLTQANFVARQESHEPGTDSEAEAAEEISEDFLAALPPDIRAEVMEEHKREQLRRTGGLEVVRRRGAGRARASAVEQPQSQGDGGAESADEQSDGQDEEQVLKLAPRPHRPTFTVRRLWKPDDLREAVTQWHREFRDEGPYAEDTEALGRYLASVVSDEGDIAKAAGVLRWLDWTLNQQASQQASASGEAAWHRALTQTRECVEQAARRRGLGMIDVYGLGMRV